jgi:tetratricopeptide (TPR) repeat protein
MAFLLLLPSFASGQSSEQLNRCTESIKLATKATDDWISSEQMADYKKGTLSFGTEAQKNEYLRKFEALQNEYSIRDPEELKEAVLKSKLHYSREEMTYCSGIEEARSQAMTLDDIGQALTKLKQADDAIPVLQRCLALKPDFAPCWDSLGEASEQLGRPAEAMGFYKRTIETGGIDELNASAINRAKLSLFMLEHPGGDPACAPGAFGLKDHLPQCRAYLDAAPSDGGKTAATHSFGTGFFVSNQGYILTNNHVVAGCKNLATGDGKPLQLLSKNARSDLALLQANFTPSSVAVFRSGAAPKLGDAVVAFGFPLPGILSSEGNVSTGVLSATSGIQNDIRFVQISAPVQPGNSGGPLFDSSGHVIGVVVAKLDALEVARATGDVPQNVNFAVHWSEVRAFLDEEGVQYRKEPSQRDTSTRNIAATATQIAVTIACTQ